MLNTFLILIIFKKFFQIREFHNVLEIVHHQTFENYFLDFLGLFMTPYSFLKMQKLSY